MVETKLVFLLKQNINTIYEWHEKLDLTVVMHGAVTRDEVKMSMTLQTV